MLLSLIRLIKETLLNLNKNMAIHFDQAYFLCISAKVVILLYFRKNVHNVKDGTDRFM